MTRCHPKGKAPRDALHYLYVTQRDGKLIGVLNMRDLMLAAPREAIESLVRRGVVSVPATMDSEEVVQVMRGLALREIIPGMKKRVFV